jgi:hypothetical protein
MTVDDPFFGYFITYNLPEETVESSSGGMYIVLVVSGFTGGAGSNETYGGSLQRHRSFSTARTLRVELANASGRGLCAE